LQPKYLGKTSTNLISGDQRGDQPQIELLDVVKTYPTASGELMVLDHINLSVETGEFVGIIGKSGAGKTTLINMIAGIDYLNDGRVWINGCSVHDLNEDQRAEWRGKNLGIVFQSFALMPTLTLLQNVLLPLDFCGLYDPRISVERGLSILDEVELVDHAHKLPSEISGGQQQRVAIARALINDPPVILADEPTGRLDSVTAQTILKIFEQVNRQGKTIIMVTHDRSQITRMSRGFNLESGKLVELS